MRKDRLRVMLILLGYLVAAKRKRCFRGVLQVRLSYLKCSCGRIFFHLEMARENFWHMFSRFLRPQARVTQQ